MLSISVSNWPFFELSVVLTFFDGVLVKVYGYRGLLLFLVPVHIDHGGIVLLGFFVSEQGLG